VLSAGDRDGYFQDFSGQTRDLAATINRGWFYAGQTSEYRGAPRGTDPAGMARERMVICLQNHDQIGNRAFGDRLHHQTDRATYRALTAVLLCAPETPLLFMGQEWAAGTPFQYFTDHHAELGQLVTEGRRREFSRFEAFRDEAMIERIPDPQAASTFEASRLNWAELGAPDHAATLEYYRALIALRATTPALRPPAGAAADAPDDDTLVVARTAPGGQALVLVARLRGAGVVALDSWRAGDAARAWSVALTSEDAPFVPPEERADVAGRRPVVDLTAGAASITFARPGAVVLIAEAA
jgi:maltooligosyltrehalose trehalohydrolase